MNRPRITALRITRNNHVFGGNGDLMRDEPGIGAYHYLSCGTFEEQNGCDIPDFAKNSPPDKWITLAELGLKWRINR